MQCPRCRREYAEGGTVCLSCDTPVGEPASIAVDDTGDLDGILEILRRDLAGVYEVENVLGQGGMAYVFKATEVELGRPVALKVLRPEMLVTKSATERFKQEARIAGGLNHPGIIPIYRVGNAGGVFYIAMKYVEGRSLHSIVESQGALPIPAVLNVLRASLGAIAFAHDRGIVHRDIKGGNILVDVEGHVTVADFGLARPIEDTGMTATGAILGTPSFMSPEQWSGARLTAQSDQYAVGIMAFHLVTGKEPFGAESMMGVMQHHLFTPVPDIRVSRGDVPPALVAVIRRALAKDPKDRYTTTGEMLAAVQQLPYSDADARESTDLLRQLAQGVGSVRITTRALPALPDVTQLIHPGGTTLARRLMGPWPLLAAGFAALLATMIWLWPDSAVPSSRADSAGVGNSVLRAPPPVRSRPASIARVVEKKAKAPAPVAPAPVIQPVGKGKVRLSTIPATAEVRIDGKKVGVGSVFDYEVPAGPRRLTLVAPGYQTFDTTFTVRAEETNVFPRIALQPREREP